MKTTNPVGRRSYNEVKVSIPGNLDETEPDLDYSEDVSVIVPFGDSTYIMQVYYITIAITAIAILGIGVLLIKRKVLGK
jgi:hypothetical protein